MRLLNFINAKSSLLFISGILIVIVGFIFISCGKGPQTKALVCDKGNFAVDFSTIPLLEDGNVCYELGDNKKTYNYKDCKGQIDGGSEAEFPPTPILPDLGEREFTIEAWIKRVDKDKDGTPDPLNGGIFRRFNPGRGGILLRVKNNVPQFGMRIPLASSTEGVSSTVDYIVDSGFTLDGLWHHIAGVLANEEPPLPHPASCIETPHLEIYVDGILKNCGTTDKRFLPDDEAPGCIPSDIDSCKAFPDQFTLGGPDPLTSELFNGVIDEVRFWVSDPGSGGARTATKIANCWNKELSFEAGDCKINPGILKGYWRLNEGQGSIACDASGNGFSGFKFLYPPADNPPPWPGTGGWAEGAIP